MLASDTGISQIFDLTTLIDGNVLFKDLTPFDQHRAAILEEIRAFEPAYMPAKTSKLTKTELRGKL